MNVGHCCPDFDVYQLRLRLDYRYTQARLFAMMAALLALTEAAIYARALAILAAPLCEVDSKVTAQGRFLRRLLLNTLLSIKAQTYTGL